MQIEVEQKYLRNNHCFVSLNGQQRLLQQLRSVFVESEIAQEERDKNHGIITPDNVTRAKLNKTFSDIRKEIISLTSQGITFNKNKLRKRFDEFYEINKENYFSRVIMDLCETKQDKDKIVSDWKKNNSKYPFTTLWIKAYLYARYHAAVELNTPIDKKPQNDFEQVVLCKDIDIFISNDRRFLKDVFLELYRGTKKQLMGTEEFVALIGRK